ncbi:type II toxin-antitoxin system RelE/ParE family toxin [Pontiellaceae bacterium B12227]|nr:type II toxin-antitoxin system RelE/ParE family toxin [Pontiellaceae bacterium B12227]
MIADIAYVRYMNRVAKKTYIAVEKVRKFIDQQSDVVQSEYLKIVEQLESDGRLVEPYGKKLDKGLFEMRIRRGGQTRVLYFYHEKEYVVGVHGFVKKTQKTPQKELKQAFKIMGMIRRGEYDE